MSAVKHGVLYRDPKFCTNPEAMVAALAEDFTRRGGEFVREKVADIEMGPNGPRAVSAADDRREVDVVVIAAGAWSRRLAAGAGAPVPLDTERGYFADLPQPGAMPHIPLLSGDYKFALTPMETGLRLAGTDELAGLHAPPNYARARTLVRAATRVLAELNDDGATYAMGFRPSMPDSLPVIGPSPRHPLVFLAFGHGHMGLTFGPVTGRIIADMVAERRPPLDVTPFRADRF